MDLALSDTSVDKCLTRLYLTPNPKKQNHTHPLDSIMAKNYIDGRATVDTTRNKHVNVEARRVQIIKASILLRCLRSVPLQF